MNERLQYMRDLRRVGLLQMRGLYSYVLGLGTSLVALGALSPAWLAAHLPTSMLPHLDRIVDGGKYAVLIGMILKTVQAQSKKVVPDAPAATAPSIFDDERDSENPRVLP